MDIKWLEDFIALVEQGSFTKAAEVRHVTQSGLSRRIRSLECALGVDLVQKNAYPTTLTNAGTENVEGIRALLKHYYDLQGKVHESDKQEKMLTLTTQHALSIYFFPKWYRNIRNFENKVGIRIQANDFHDCLLSFLEEQCDLLLCYYSADICQQLTKTNIQSLQVGADQLIPVALAGSDYVREEDYCSPIPLIGYPSETFFGQLIQKDIKSKLPPSVKLDLLIETAMSDSIKSMVLQGMGMSWLPRAMVDKELFSGELIQMPSIPSLDMKVMLYRHRTAKNTEIDSLWHSLSR